MTELRRDPITGRTVIVAPARATRPITAAARWEFQPGPCPFCPGHEDETPPPRLVRAWPAEGDVPPQRIRVVPNRYPAVESDDGLAEPPRTIELALGEEAGGSELFPRQPARGEHDVIIESDRHVGSLAALSAIEVGRVAEVYRLRLAELAAGGRWPVAVLFKNVGAAAGASLEHTHSQVLALSEVPDVLRIELAGASAYHARRGRCVYCDLAERELAAGERIVAATDEFVALAPWASRWPLEIWVWPRGHQSRYDRQTPEAAHRFGEFFQGVLARLERVLGQAGYNFFLHQAPFDSLENPHYHWHVEIIPRLTTTAGFEWGTDWFVNPLPPELAAAMLRGAGG